MQYPRISIVTPSFNHGKFLERTILSIINQGYPNLEYIIVDGGSTDETLSIIKKYEQHISYWVSEKDSGLYNALNKGFQKSTGEIMGWLNADDILHDQSLFILSEIFSQQEEVEWLQGYPTVIDEIGRIIYHRQARHSKYSFYFKDYHDGVFIQQESTYWRRSLWQKSGSVIEEKYRYAGDFELWIRFYNYAKLYNTQALIGAFRVHGSGQLSAVNYKAYIAECDRIIESVLSELPDEEKAKTKKLGLLRRINSRMPALSRLFRINRPLIKDLHSPNEILFDFEKQKFYIRK